MLSQIKLKPNYNSYFDNVVDEFYNKVLKESIVYDRASAYFSAKAIANISDGISYFYKNGGKIRFIISNEISQEEYEIIKKGYEAKNTIYSNIAQKFNESNSLLNDDDLIKLSNLSYLIEKGVVDIKIAFKPEGIFHDKFGLIGDEDGNVIYFRGSNNETIAAIEKNYESFDVTCSWLASDFEKERIRIAHNQFENLWNNKVDNLFIIDAPDVIKNKLLIYNKGKLVSSDEFNEHTIKFDYDEDSKKFYAKLGNKININIKNYLYKIDIALYVDKIENDRILFKDSISYIKYSKIIEKFKEYANIENKKGNTTYIYIDNHYKKYINRKDFRIKERYELGKCIKEENRIANKEIEKSFNDFCEILDNTMERKLKIKQLWNAFHIVKMKKSANFSVPGAGKTTIIYGAYAYLNYFKLVDKIIVIGPKSSFTAWKNEFKLNFGEKKKLNVCDIQSINKDELIEKSVNANLILINYEALPGLKKELNYIIKENSLLVFDEVHKIKGIGKIRADIAIAISSKPNYKVVLSGTPIPNGYEDIYNMLNILYKDEYNDFFGFTPKYLKNSRKNNELVINEKIYPFFCRTTKKELSVPEPDEDKLLFSTVSNEEEQLFLSLKEKYKSNPFTYYIRMMQAMTNPELLLNDLDSSEINELFVNDYDETYLESNLSIENIEDCKKINDVYIKELIRKIGNTNKFKLGIEKVSELVQQEKSVLVWGIFTKTLEKIKKELDDLKIKSEIIDGKVGDLSQREEIINKFLNKKIDVLIANPNTLAESVSLHSICHDAVYMEYSFNYTHMAQSRDRINRLGLKPDDYTRYYYMVSGTYDKKDSVDLIIYNRLQEKQKLMLQAIENGELVSVKENLTEDILKLLKD